MGHSTKKRDPLGVACASPVMWLRQITGQYGRGASGCHGCDSFDLICSGVSRTLIPLMIYTTDIFVDHNNRLSCEAYKNFHLSTNLCVNVRAFFNSCAIELLKLRLKIFLGDAPMERRTVETYFSIRLL